ncbi:NDRG3-like protein 1 [Dinothrombium tinctorium]|uniref:NDRG3-like protein 1 n=1 Tax=Dinothrombium tinctorium TaxID=1965070 RepID=A0A443RR06_9ACAR|nr:NDRG3-like protein 1 [Dinothrombium tinctorium]
MSADIELRNVEANSPLMRSLSRSEDDFVEERVETDFGSLLVARQGIDHKSTTKPVILTYHDIGLNHVSNFQAFFNYMDMRLLLKSFAVFHINAPGQEENSATLPDNYDYPTMDQLAEQIRTVCKHYAIKSIIGLGVGAGANILSRFALSYPDLVDGLFLINATSTQSSWTEWFYQKLNIYYLHGTNPSNVSNNTFPHTTQEYLMWHHFGKVTPERNHDLVELYRSYFTGKTINARNLSLFMDSYIKRTDLGLVRGDKERNFKCPVLLLCGAFSPHVDDTVTMNSRLDPTNSTWMKLSDCGMVLEEQPGKVEEALRLFIQGLGYALSAYERRRSSLRKMSMSTTSGEGVNGHDSRKNSIEEEISLKQNQSVHIVENPIAQC